MEPIDSLGSDLREAAETLEQALAEACEARSARHADTGELIKIEEMLALASEAARRAISIRRKVRAAALDAQQADTAATEADVSPAPASNESATVPGHRLFRDREGVSWDVWAVYPEARPTQLSALPGTFQTGWLVFESARDKRRLSPIPGGWDLLSSDDLERLCQQAEAAAKRTGLGDTPRDDPPIRS